MADLRSRLASISVLLPLLAPSAPASEALSPPRATDAGVCVPRPGGGALSLELAAAVRAGARIELAPSTARGPRARVERARGAGVTEWYVPRGRGLQQGFTLEHRLLGEGPGPLALELVLGGDAGARIARGGRSLVLEPLGGGARVHYAGLAAWDADGRELDARLVARPGGFAIEVDDRGARYPVTVDPVLFTEEGVLRAGDAGPDDSLGVSVGVHADTAVAGARGDDDLGTDAGAAYVFVRAGTTWSQQAKLLAGDGSAGDELGRSIAVSGDVALVGAPFHDPPTAGMDAGAAYVFERAGTVWTQQFKLLASNGVPDNRFGTSVALEGDLAVVGAPRAHGADINSGALYVFRRSGAIWIQQAILFASDGTSFEELGSNVALSGTTVATGIVRDNRNGAFSGTAYVFHDSGAGWVEEAILTPLDGFPGQTFGVDVALSGDRLAVGANGDTTAGGLAGAVYVFERSGTTWTEVAKVVGDDTQPGDQLGFSVALDGDRLAAGAWGEDDAASMAGAAYVFGPTGGGWAQEGKTTASDGSADDQLGRAIDLFGTTLVLGAPGQDAGGNGAGSAYAFELTPIDVETYCTGKTSSLGCVPFVQTSGLPSASATGPFSIRGLDLLPDEAGLLLYAFKKANLNFHGGKLCVKVPFERLVPKFAKNTGPPPCVGVVTRNFNNHVQSGNDPLLTAGQTVRAQWRQRDPGDPLGFGDTLTDAVQFQIAP